MSVMQPTAPRHTAGPDQPGSRHAATTATLALARAEGRRLLRHPIVLAAIALVLIGWIVPVFTGSANKFPVLYLEDSVIQVEMTLIAAAVMIAANLAVLRTHRHGVSVFTDVLALPTWRRTLAHLLTLLPLAAVTGVLAVARIGQLSLRPGAVGQPGPLDLAVVPALVLLFGAVGVLLASLVRSTVVAPLLLVLLLFSLLFSAPSGGTQKRLSWLLPVTVDADFRSGGPPPAQAIHEPAVAHLLYLLALAMVLAVAALLRSAAPPVRTALAGALALLIVVISGAAQLRPTPADIVARRIAMTDEPSRFHSCNRHDNVTYCAFPEFVPWTGAWRQVVDGIRRRVPAERATAPLAVRQRMMIAKDDGTGQTGSSVKNWQSGDRRAGTPDAVSVGTDWGTPRATIGLAVPVAYRMTGSSGIEAEHVLACGGAGILTIWLAAQSTPVAAQGLSETLASTSGTRTVTFASISTGQNIDVGGREITVAQQLLDRPADQVAAAANRSWSQLTSPKTSVERAAQLLGATAPPKLSPLPAEERSFFGECG